MNIQVLAVMIQEGSKLISDFIKSRPLKRPQPVEETNPATTTIIGTEKVVGETSARESKEQEGVACVPCCNSHFSVCAGLVSDESIRMARRHGIGDEEISRINKCLDQLNAMEREDLSADKMARLPAWEKDIAIYAQNQGAAIRHKLENLESVDDLESAAIQIKEARTKIGKDWFKQKLARMPKGEKEKLAAKAIERLEEE